MSSLTSVNLRSLFVVLLTVFPLPSHARTPHYRPIRHTTIERNCHTETPSDELVQSHQYLHENEPGDNDLWNSSTVRTYGTSSRKERQTTLVYTVDTYIHIVDNSTSASPASPLYINDTMIANQFTYLQQSYAPVSIGFNLLGVDRVTNDLWAANGDDTAMKTSLRRGTYSTLNLYYQANLQVAPGTPGVPPNSTLLGYCSLPAAGVTTTTPASEYIVDGCNILSSTVPGGSQYAYNIGGTTSHEVGHWNGLLHTFQDYSCDAYDWGDYVADTPQEGSSTNGCPSSKDTCPSSGVAAGWDGGPGEAAIDPYGPQGYSGVDPIHNFMDYSTDACYTGFTTGQGARMINLWGIYRGGL